MKHRVNNLYLSTNFFMYSFSKVPLWIHKYLDVCRSPAHDRFQ